MRFSINNTCKPPQFSTVIFILTFVVWMSSSACEKTDTKKEITQEITSQNVLSSWNDTPTKNAIIKFVSKTTDSTNQSFIPIADRIACFDNDGTLWAEQPIYFQLAFAIDRIKALAPSHPEWKNQEPYKSILEGNISNVLAGGEHALLEIIMATHANISTDSFSLVVKNWIDTASNPATGKHYKDMIYLPMLELLNYLRANNFKTFIVSGGGVDFMRVFAETLYGIPPYQVIGSSGKTQYIIKDDVPTIQKLPELNFIDDGAGKPIGIYQYIGKRPVFASGNSDGDYQMLQWTSAGDKPNMCLLVHHTDSIREFAYDRNSAIGKLNKGLDDAEKYNWIIVDIQKDWKQVFKN
ncbi:MAG: haloacid dehalogenase-like hydrolase [Chitinophagales bacterium]|nr:haloacid dehalogenase-like hydrolase [Chitinophagales bacterium]MBP9189076.1 haloacid dehalogenase-like hydrolase [Chitinophagales bacterium]MBP9548898.1 haloacid dehalogenase-like hydrolase [Chitinophagales bacterium]